MYNSFTKLIFNGKNQLVISAFYLYAQFCRFWYNGLFLPFFFFFWRPSVMHDWNQLSPVLAYDSNSVRGLSNPPFLLSNRKITLGYQFVVFIFFWRHSGEVSVFYKDLICFSRWNDKFTATDIVNQRSALHKG